MKHLAPSEAYEFLRANPNAVLVDVRSEMEYLFVGHPKDALLIPWQDGEYFDLNPDFLGHMRKASSVNRPVVLICRSGNRSKIAGEFLEKHGFPEVHNVLHGFEGDLAANARDAMPHGGKLIIETAGVQVDEAFRCRHGDLRPGHHALLTVSDNGIGMDEQTRQQIFDPFFTTKEMGRGTGLGLSTVFGIVNQNGGMNTVHSKPGHGATFKIYLPCLPDEAAEFEGEKQEEEPRGTETILLVEDDEMVLKLTTTMLTALGYTVLTAKTPAAALALAGRMRVAATDTPEVLGLELDTPSAPDRLATSTMVSIRK